MSTIKSQAGQQALTEPPRRGGLARYVLAATLARSADGGAVVAVVLLVTTSGAPGWLAGVMGACITAPHLFGPFIARTLDTARDGRNVIALACMAHGLTLAAAVVLYPVSWPLIPAALLIASGMVGPLLTGGISSRLAGIAGNDRTSQRRAQGWDVATYGIGGTIGPSLVAAVSAWTNASVAALILAGSTFLAAAVIRLLPYVPPTGRPSEVPRPGQTLMMMVSRGVLRRTLYLTVVVALSVAALPIAAVASTQMLGVTPAAAGVLTAAYGLGGLVGSAGVMVRPLRSEADTVMSRLAAAVGVALLVVSVAATFPLAVAAFVFAGVLNSYFFAATLAARSEYAPAEARAQVFVWIGALKITAGSAGTALAGAIVTSDSRLPLVLATGLVAVVVTVSVFDRQFTVDCQPE